MIFVDRSRVLQPGSLEKVDRSGRTETERAIEYFGINPNGSAFEFKAYSDPEVKTALITLFNGKCAYCESTFLHVYSGDIEHFRPKAEIFEANPRRPGYYWLASDWNNLLLSCRNCNQKLSHTIFGLSEKKTMGKMNQFPLSELDKFVRHHDVANGVHNEEPYRLLLNPCVDNPEEHLEYGEEGTIRPKKDGTGLSSLKGKTSIDVYVLQRVPL